MSHHSTIIFDFDGTIADSFMLIMSVFNELSKRDTQASDEEIARLRQLSLPRVAEELAMPKWRIPYLLFRGRKKMGQRISEVRPFEGIPEALQQLHETDYHLCIVSSNSTRNIQQFLDANDLTQYFNGIYGDIGLFGKARAVRQIIKRNGLQPSDCIYVGDEARDVEASKHAGVKCIAAAWGFNAPELLEKHHPDAMARDPEELVKFITAWRGE